MLIATFVAGGLSPSPARAASRVSPARKTAVVEAVARIQPAVVSIASEKLSASNARWPFSPEESTRSRVSGMGTGVVLDRRGFIITNHHVVDRVEGIEVRLNDGAGTTLPARVIQSDPVMDLAILKVDSPRPLTEALIGTSSDLMVGEDVITVGNAFGYENTVSVGIISALGRNVTLSDDQVYRNLIQTDACINPGNSGGPLVNIKGELVGINVAVRAGAQGIGFALPIDDVLRSAAEMLSTRRLAATWHGIATESRPDDEGVRLLVSQVQSTSPGEKAGIKPGDQIVRVGELETRNPLDLERALLESQSDVPVAVVVKRDGSEVSTQLAVRALSRAQPDAGDQIWWLLGVKTRPVSAATVSPVSRELHGGLYVSDVLPGSSADRASIQPGDILIGLSVGERHWETILPDNVLHILRQPEVSGAQQLTYYIVRSNSLYRGSITILNTQAANGTMRR
ncbi:PDZ domain-containing protein [bacterium]|nr:PDZ domain-containing protein [bacterium]